MHFSRNFALAAFAAALTATGAASPQAADATPDYAAQCVPHAQACKLYIAQLVALDNQQPSSASGSGAEQPLGVKCTQTVLDGRHDAAILYDIDWATFVYNGMNVTQAKMQASKNLGGSSAQTAANKCNLIKLYKLVGGGAGSE